MKYQITNKSILNVTYKFYEKEFGKFHKNYKYNFSDYLNTIIYYLRFHVAFNRITDFCKISSTSCFNFYKKMIEKNIFEKVYNYFITRKYKNVDDIKFLCMVDSTMIDNECGKNVGYFYYNKKKKGSKLSVIINEYKIPLSFALSKASTSDIILFEKNINKPIVNLNNRIILGDKGYISNALKNKLKTENNINLITPYRKNQKTILNDKEKKLMKKRHIIENYFASLKKKFKSIRLRYTKKDANFLSIIYLSAILMLF